MAAGLVALLLGVRAFTRTLDFRSPTAFWNEELTQQPDLAVRDPAAVDLGDPGELAHRPGAEHLAGGVELGQGDVAHLDRQPGGSDPVDQLAELFQAGLRRERQLLIALAEHAKQPAHLIERLLSRPFDGGERLTRVSWVGLEHPSTATRLENHDADRVCDHVVELPRDPCSLSDDRRGGPCPLVLELALVEAPLTDGSTGPPR